jgi:hypothetical protein
MRRFLLSSLVCLVSLSAFSQSIPTSSPQAKPQIAYRLFSNWADNYQAEATRGKAIGQGVLFGGGALLLGGAAATWYGGDRIATEISGSPMDPELKQNLALGLGIGGITLLASGMIVGSVPIKDYRAIYADVFMEKDPEVQEAMAASVLHYQADKGKERRITSFISGIAVPLVAGLITAGINTTQGKSWDAGLWDSLKGSSWSIGGSIIYLFEKTPEERLYERYLSTRDALYAEGR